MGVLALIVAVGIFASCQKDETLMEAENELMLKKALVKEVVPVTFDWSDACAGEQITFTLTGDGEKQIKMWAWDETTQEFQWIQVANAGSSLDPLTFDTTLTKGDYYFIYKVGKDWIPGNPSSKMEEGILVEVENCDVCDDASFGYETEDNLDIKFSYNHDEVVENLTIQFTFTQVKDKALNEDGKYVGADGKLYEVNNHTNQTVFTWTGAVSCKATEAETFSFHHAADCGPSTANDGTAVIWTDTKIIAVNGVELVDDPETQEIVEGPVSLKGNLPNIVYSGCPIK